MAAYNRRWYILSSIIGALGIGLIGALLGIEEFIVMDITDDDSTNSTACNFDVSTRKLGFFTGTDKTCTFAGEKLAEHWPMLCMGKTDYCQVGGAEQEKKYPRLCECKSDDGIVAVNAEIEPIYETGLHWAIFSLLVISALIGIYASGTAFYNGITKPLQEYLSVRAVLYSFIGAITFNIISLILSVVYLFIGFKGDDCPMIDGFVGLNGFIPSEAQGWKCDKVSFGFGFYFEIISLVCFVLAIAAAWMGQRGFQSIDEGSKIDQEKEKDVGVSTSMMF